MQIQPGWPQLALSECELFHRKYCVFTPVVHPDACIWFLSAGTFTLSWPVLTELTCPGQMVDRLQKPVNIWLGFKCSLNYLWSRGCPLKFGKESKSVVDWRYTLFWWLVHINALHTHINNAHVSFCFEAMNSPPYSNYPIQKWVTLTTRRVKSVHAVTFSIINFFEEYPIGLFVPAFYGKTEGLT